MIEVIMNLHVGNKDDYENCVKFDKGWAVVHACKEPYHRELLGYTSKGAPKDHPEYLIAERGDRLFLNLVDTVDPAYIPKEIVDKALHFVENALSNQKKCLIHCNQGMSRAPSIALLYLAKHNHIPNDSLMEAEEAFMKIYPKYFPKPGIQKFLENNWTKYVKK